MLWGLPLSQILLAGMAWQATRRRSGESAGFQGYPFHAAVLTGPAVLVTSVLIGHFLVPHVSIVTLITLLAPLYPLIANRHNQPRKILTQYVCHDLPHMGPEIVLFIAAGILGTGLSSLIATHAMSLAVGHNQVLLVSAGLAVILAASCLGIHPVVGITVVGGVLAAANLNQNLLAMSFLMGWGLGVLINPTSGIHLFLSGRYAFAARNAWRWNLRFVIVAYAVSCSWLTVFFIVS